MNCNSLQDQKKNYRPFMPKVDLKVVLCLLVVLSGCFATFGGFAHAKPQTQEEPYVAPPYVPPPPLESKIDLIDNNDGTISAPDTGLMWARKDSYSDLGRCLDWHESETYVKQLKTGGYTDWRMPSLEELAGIYDVTKESVIAWDHDENYPLCISEKFADGAAYWVWAAETEKTNLTDCCAYSFYFVKGMIHIRRFTMCTNGGVRAVRNIR